jgi:hypothetical protein
VQGAFHPAICFLQKKEVSAITKMTAFKEALEILLKDPVNLAKSCEGLLWCSSNKMQIQRFLRSKNKLSKRRWKKDDMDVPMFCCCSSTTGQAIRKAQTLPSSSFPPGIMCHRKCSITFNIRSLCTSRGLWEVGMAVLRRWCDHNLRQHSPQTIINLGTTTLAS